MKPRHPRPKIIQQWQAFGRLPAAQADDTAYRAAVDIGITSLQSYVYWSAVEEREGMLDFSVYDEVADKISKHGLKWTPFVILGPNYSIPRWFHESSECIYARCAEHMTECDIQSIWSPHILARVDGFMRLLTERYAASGIIESVLLGVSGVWGEALYPSSDGIRRRGHRHSGWWCADDYARKDFADACRGKYASPDDMNAAWGTDFKDFASAEFPVKQIFYPADLAWKVVRKVLSAAPLSAGILKPIFEDAFNRRLFRGRVTDPHFAERMLFFARWYTGAMTAYAGKWLDIARKHFPGKDIFLVAGGHGDTITGADFSAQAAAAASREAGIRITSMTGDYAESHARKALVTTAAAFYGAPVQTEETIETSADEVAMRIFDGGASGASGIYFKTLMGTDYGEVVSCTGKRDNCLPVGKPSPAGTMFKKLAGANLGSTFAAKAIAAVLIAKDSVALYPSALSENLEAARKLRSRFDFDIIDELLLSAGIAAKYSHIISYFNPSIGAAGLSALRTWVDGGGVLFCRKNAIPNGLCEPSQDNKITHSSDYSRHLRGKGKIFEINPAGAAHFASNLVDILITGQTRVVYPFSPADDGIYFVYDGNGFLLYNSRYKPALKDIILPSENRLTFDVPARDVVIAVAPAPKQ